MLQHKIQSGDQASAASLQALLTPGEAHVAFKRDTQKAILDLVSERFHPQSDISDVLSADKYQVIADEVARFRGLMDQSPHFVLIDRIDGVTTVLQQQRYTWILGNLFGPPMIQNDNDDLMIQVYDRGNATIETGARYHQTKQGSYIHNDGVSYEDPISYLVLSCVNSAFIGGESILVDATLVENELKNYPDVLRVLTDKFWFEKRGMGAEAAYFQAPIIEYSDLNKAIIRYFRVYIESAHRNVGSPLTADQKKALDCLDSIIDQISVQYRVRLNPGQVLISSDRHFLHSRTSFVDNRKPVSEASDHDRMEAINRYMLRIWSKRATNL